MNIATVFAMLCCLTISEVQTLKTSPEDFEMALSCLAFSGELMFYAYRSGLICVPAMIATLMLERWFDKAYNTLLCLCSVEQA